MYNNGTSPELQPQGKHINNRSILLEQAAASGQDAGRDRAYVVRNGHWPGITTGRRLTFAVRMCYMCSPAESGLLYEYQQEFGSKALTADAYDIHVGARAMLAPHS